MKVWDWMTGKEKHDILVQEAVEPFIVVKGKKRRWYEEEEMGDENSTVRIRKKGRKGKGKGKAKLPVQDVDMGEARDNGGLTPPGAEDILEDVPQESIRPEVEELVLVIHKIDSFETSRGKYLVFSAVGYVLCSLPPPLRAQLKFYFKLHVSFCLRFPFARWCFVSRDFHLRLSQACDQFLHSRFAFLGSR